MRFFLTTIPLFILRYMILNHVVANISYSNVYSYNMNDDVDRQLQTDDRLCDQLIGVVTTDEIRELGRLHISPYYSSSDTSTLQTALDVIYFPSIFNVAVYKSCSSCEIIDQVYLQRLQTLPVYHTNGYCSQISSPVYGSIHSSLVMIPIDPTVDITNGTSADVVAKAILQGYTMRAFLSLRPTRLDYKLAPTEYFPSNLTEFMMMYANDSEIMGNVIVDYATALIATSSGSIGIIPDYLGFGTSAATSNRTVMNGMSFDVAGSISFLGARELVTNLTNNCSSVDMAAITIQGIDDGAFGVPFVSYALREFDVQSTTLFIAAGPLDVETFWNDVIATANDTTTIPTRLSEIWDSSIFTYNVGSSAYQSLLDQKFLNPGDDTVILPSGKNLTDIISADLLTFLRTKLSDLNITFGATGTICDVLLDAADPSSVTATVTTSVNDLLVAVCTELRDNSAWKYLDTTSSSANTQLQLSFPVISCFSETDEVYSSNQFTDMNTSVLEANNLYQRFVGPVSATALNVAAGRDHNDTLALCIVSPMLFLSLQGVTPDKLQDRPNYISYYVNPGGQCNNPTTLPDTAQVPQAGTENPSDNNGMPATPGSSPSGSAPSGSAPSGSSPSGSAPSGSAPSPSGSATSPSKPSAPSPSKPSATSPTSAGNTVINTNYGTALGLSMVTTTLLMSMMK